MQRFNHSSSPSCASNIDYHLEQLAKCIRASNEKTRSNKAGKPPRSGHKSGNYHKTPSGDSLLIKKLVEINPKNARFVNRQMSMTPKVNHKKQRTLSNIEESK
jgi:hypothetical protein